MHPEIIFFHFNVVLPQRLYLKKKEDTRKPYNHYHHHQNHYHHKNHHEHHHNHHHNHHPKNHHDNHDNHHHLRSDSEEKRGGVLSIGDVPV